MKAVKRALVAHIRVGYVLAVLLVPLLCMAAVLADTIRAGTLGISPTAALQVTPKGRWVFHGALIFAIMSIAIPAIVAPWVALSRGTRPLTSMLRSRGLAIVLIHLALSLASAVGLVFCYQLQTAGGDSWVGGHLQAAFSSLYVGSVTKSPLLVWLAVVGVITVLGGLSLFFSWPLVNTRDVGRYLTRLELAALTGPLVPAHGRRDVNLRTAALAPALQGIRKRWLKTISRYNRCVPGSRNGVALLTSSWARVKELLPIVGISETAGMQLRFVGSTSRALELAIREVGAGGKVLLSPYEHPSECKVADALGPWEQMPVEDDFFGRPWNEQKEDIIDWAARTASKSTAVLVLSEIAYLTGRVIPVEEVASAVRARAREANSEVRVVIDGAHAVGNEWHCGHRAVGAGDAYVFSGHKWLLAPEPCGIILCGQATACHDAWVQDLPSSSVGVAAVSGLLAALEFRNSLNQRAVEERTRELRALVTQTTHERLEELGEGSGLRATNLITLRPRAGFRWTRNLGGASVADVLARDRFYVTGIIHREDEWIRIAILGFLDWRAIQAFGRAICRLVEPAA